MADGRNLRKEMEAEAEKNGSVRRITFEELAGEMAAYKPRPIRNRKKIADLDPYFSVLDNGREYVMQKKKCSDLVEKLPGELQQILSELEALMKQMTYDAIEDDYDYQDRMDRYYLNMIRVNQLCGEMKFKLKRLSNNQKAVERYLGEPGSPKVTNFMTRIGVLTTAASELSTSCNIFMDKMEKDYDILLPEHIKVRELARDNAVLSAKMN
ncbi:MAG: hypothetical protein K6C95_04410 [Lachnospiraceae bacterium]|nr:hypothetical protein [Lachnospiraceae bacterium]